MKTISAFVALSAALSTSVLASPANIAARATATSSSTLPAVSVKGNGIQICDIFIIGSSKADTSDSFFRRK